MRTNILYKGNAVFMHGVTDVAAEGKRIEAAHAGDDVFVMFGSASVAYVVRTATGDRQYHIYGE
jgi:hypothetical protein